MYIRSILFATAFAATIALGATAHACEGRHVAVSPAELDWKNGPGSLPRGAEFVVIEGDPAQAGPFTGCGALA